MASRDAKRGGTGFRGHESDGAGKKDPPPSAVIVDLTDECGPGDSQAHSRHDAIATSVSKAGNGCDKGITGGKKPPIISLSDYSSGEDERRESWATKVLPRTPESVLGKRKAQDVVDLADGPAGEAERTPVRRHLMANQDHEYLEALQKDREVDLKREKEEKSAREEERRKQREEEAVQEKQQMLEAKRISLCDFVKLPEEPESSTDAIEISVQLLGAPNLRRVRRFPLSVSWGDVKDWVVSEMAKEKRIPLEQMTWPEDFELASNYPLSVLSGVRNRTLGDDKKILGKRARLIIHKE